MNQALMSSNVQRQTIPLSKSKKYIVGTELECQVTLDSGVPLVFIKYSSAKNKRSGNP